MFQAIMLDAVTGIQDAGIAIGDQFGQFMESVIPIAREIEEGRIELEKFLTASHDFSEVEKEVTALGLSFGFAADEAFQASARMAQLSGVMGTGTMGVGTELGMQFGLISGMSTEGAMQRMINLQQQTHFMTEGIAANASEQERQNQIRSNSIKILDQLNTVENRSAATMEQITYVMNQFAAQAHLTGQSIASMAAMSATLIEAGEEQGKGGRALRMIYARLGANTGGAADAFHELGIATKDADDNLRSFADIMKDLNKIYPELTSSERTRLAQQVAGNRHYTRFLKLSENYNRVLALEFEALMRLSPALEEIQRRRDTDLFQLTEAEARLKNYTGAIGYGLMPALTKATNRHADFNKEIAIIVGSDGLIGKGVGQMFQFGSEMRDLIGPMVNVMINMQSLNVAFQTQQTIMRALNQEEIVNQNAYGNKSQVLQSHSSMLQHINTLVAEHTARIEMNTIAAKYSANLTKEEIALEITFQATLADRLKEQSNITLSTNMSIASEKKHKLSIQETIDGYNREKIAQEKVIITTKAHLNLLDQVRFKKNSKGQIPFKKDIQLHKDRGIATANLATEKKKLNEIIVKNSQFLEENNVKLEKSIAQIKRYGETNARAARITEDANTKMGESMKKVGFDQTKVDQKAEAKRTKDIAAAAIQASAMQKLSTNFMMAGSAAMMFGSSQKSMRIGILLNVAGMAAMFRQMQLNAAESGRSIMLNMADLKSMLGVTAVTNLVTKEKQKAMYATIHKNYVTGQEIVLSETLIGIKVAEIYALISSTAAIKTNIMAIAISTKAKVLERIESIKNLAVAKIQQIQTLHLTFATFQLTLARHIDTMAIKLNTIWMSRNAIGSGLLGVAQGFLTASYLGVAAAANFAAVGIMNTAKSAVVAFAPYAILIGLGLALTKILEGLGLWDTSIPDFASESSDLNMYTASTENLIERLKDETITIDGLRDSLAELASERATLSRQESTAADARIKQIDELTSEEQTLLDIMTARMYTEDNLPDIGAALTKNAIDNYQEGMSAFQKFKGFKGFKHSGITDGDAYFHTTAMVRHLKEFEAFAEKYPELAEMIDNANITTATGVNELMESLRMGANALTSAEMNMLTGMVDGYKEANEALQEFSNTREELFYGFSSKNLTGNLVKQVVQQGVETLITTTEVIMSNTFNGMTTTEAANQILNEIERGAGLRGMNLSN